MPEVTTQYVKVSEDKYELHTIMKTPLVLTSLKERLADVSAALALTDRQMDLIISQQSGVGATKHRLEMLQAELLKEISGCETAKEG